MSKRVIVAVEILLGILIVGSAFAALSGPEKDSGLIVSVLVLVVIFFGVLRRLSKMP